MLTPHFYNSLTKQVELFTPREPGKVSIYNCGPTVYKRQHLGNMRRFLFADFLRRSLEYAGYEVREIMNITDVGHLTQDEIDAGEDKVALAAREGKVTPQHIAEEQTKLFMQDIASLNIQPAHKYPRATQHIKEMQTLIAQLLEKKHAYQTDSGVYFDVASFPRYGALSGNTLEHLSAGKRIAVREDKKHPADFALWIFDAKALQKWDSPWGVGYPGWHIECSAMSLAYLTAPIDLHTGGIDNKFPHHENEIAQSEGATQTPFVQVWLHNGHLQLKGQKLAKRGGEQLTVDSLTEQGFSPATFRLLVFSMHYRKQVDFSWEDMAIMQEHLEALKRLLLKLKAYPDTQVTSPDQAAVAAFGEALADDLNTPQAWAIFLAYLRLANTQLVEAPASDTVAAIKATLAAFDRVLGIIASLVLEHTPESIPADIEELASQREQARQDKHFELADQLRQQIEQKGYVIEDSPHGPRIIPHSK